MKLSEIMSRDVEVVSPHTTITEAARTMRDLDTGYLPVGADGQLQGAITDRDITIRITAEGMDPNAMKVRDAMTEEVVYCFEDSDVQEAARLMSEQQIRRLPVLSRDKKLVGVVSIGDIATQSGQDEVVGEALEQISQPGQNQR
ncbi:MAG TPA: CBS domain-containing protein [Alphaproteobacteria bacterium]|nr:CBS domain-containing protein [Alphaproteobacteria bacterium]